MMMQTQGAIMAKAGVELLGVHDNRRMRLPLVDATEEEVSDLRDAMVGAGLLP